MKRLSSLLIYIVILAMPLVPIELFYYNIDAVWHPTPGIIFIFILFLAVAFYFIFFINRSKRVYYNGTSLYIYNLFSSSLVTINKHNIGSIERILFFDPNFWKIAYYDENQNAKYAYFIRNFLCDDFNTIIDEINSSETS